MPVELPLGPLESDADLSGFWIFSHIRASVRRDDQDSCHGICFVSDLVAAVGPAWQRHDVSLAELAVTVV